ncbi:MAG: SUF system Fe-S cluster assembly regulator [Gammaproteobacteria bacterium]
MLRMSKMTDYGSVVLASLARDPNAVHAAGEVADHTGLTLPTVSKLLKALARAGLVRSYRGAHGGYALTRKASEITAAEIIDALEGPIAITECSGLSSHCSVESVCALSGRWQRVNRAIRFALQEISLEQLMGPRPLPNINLSATLSDGA